jgi:hypothetical protein
VVSDEPIVDESSEPVELLPSPLLLDESADDPLFESVDPVLEPALLPVVAYAEPESFVVSELFDPVFLLLNAAPIKPITQTTINTLTTRKTIFLRNLYFLGGDGWRSTMTPFFYG